MLFGLLSCLILTFTGTFGSASAADANNQPKIKNTGDPILIATLSEVEGTSVGQLMIQALIHNGYEVEDKTGSCASVSVMRHAILNKEVDMIFDYDGDAVSYGDFGDLDAFRQPRVGWKLIHDYDLKNNQLVWLEPSEANNTFIIATTNKFAAANNIKDMDDFARYVNNGSEVKLITPSYWIDGNQNLPRMEKLYGFKLNRETQTIIAEGLNERMVAEGKDGANFCLVFANQGSLNELKMTVIDDPKNAELRYSYCPIIRQEVLEKYPEIAGILNPIFAGITNDDARYLNEQVQVQGRPGREVAIEYLTKKGFMN
jgi:osmoprotectant transport system substrate-binding protein